MAVRQNGEPTFMDVRRVTHIDISPKQILSEGTALIPFLEHDDNTRASMGSNMQRQAVALLSPQAPLVGTGLEQMVAVSSGQAIATEDDGEVIYADANTVRIVYKSGEQKEFKLLN